MDNNFIMLYGSPTCGNCKRIKANLERAKVAHLYVESPSTVEAEAIKRGVQSVPFAVINNKCFVGTSLEEKVKEIIENVGQ